MRSQQRPNDRGIIAEKGLLYRLVQQSLLLCLRVQSMVVLVRPMPMTAVEIFFQLSQPHTPSTRRLVRFW